MNWKQSGFDQLLTIGECTAVINMFHDRHLRRDAITATVTTPLFPKHSHTDFSTIGDAKAWCEQWLSFAGELLYLRKTVESLREEVHKDFAENMRLRDELHGYRYPRAESEVQA